MTFAVFDFAAIAKLTKAFAEEPPQNEVKPVEVGIPASGDLGHVYSHTNTFTTTAGISSHSHSYTCRCGKAVPLGGYCGCPRS